MEDAETPLEYPVASDEVCRQLRVLCSRKDTRTVGRPPNHPSRWQPGTVRHPVSGELFDTASAWPFIADCLDGRVPVEIKDLDHPPGKKGFVLLVDGYGEDRIYIKLQFGHRQVIGRSFHLSNERGRRK